MCHRACACTCACACACVRVVPASGARLERVIGELPDELQAKFSDAVAAERAGEAAKAAAEYQAGVKLSAGYLKEHPDAKPAIAPTLQQIMGHAKQLAAAK